MIVEKDDMIITIEGAEDITFDDDVLNDLAKYVFLPLVLEELKNNPDTFKSNK